MSKRRNCYKKSSKRKSRKKYMKGHGFRNKLVCIILFIFTIISLYYIMPDVIELKTGLDEYDDERIKQLVREVLKEQENKENEIINITEEEIKEETAERIVKEQEVTSRGGSVRMEETKSLGTYQITSYHPGDGCLSGTKTGSGKTINDFNTMKIGNKNVYTYKGKIVVACATEELLKSGYNVKGGGNRQEGKHYFRYYDEGKMNIDGTWYDFIVLDSCGAAMWEGESRIDIFVPSSSDIVNRRNVEAKI